MQVNFIVALFTGLFLSGTFLHYRYASGKGIVFRYKPVLLLVAALLFVLALYGIVTGKPYNKILPFIG